MLVHKLILKLCIACGLMVAWISAAAASDDPAVVVLFGDSITVGENESSYYQDCPKAGGLRRGFGMGRSDFCTPDMVLSALLNDSDRPAIVLNQGEGGTSSMNGVSRLGAALDLAKSQHNGSVYYVLILYGTNDFGQGLSTSDTRNNVRTMINIAEGRGFIPLVSNLLPRNDRDVSGAENGAIFSAASLEGAQFVDQYSNFNSKGGFALHDNEAPRLPASLRLHPTKQGYTVVAEHWFGAALSSLIEPLKNTPPVGPIMLLLDDESAAPM